MVSCGCCNELNEKLLLGPKLIFGCMSMIYYGFYLYRPNFLKQELEFSTAQYGYLSGMMAAVGFIFMTVWGYVADWTGRPKYVLAFVSLGTACTFSLFLLKVPGTGWSVAFLAIYAAFASGFQAMCDDQVLRLLSFTGEKNLYGKQRLWETVIFSFTTLFLGAMIKRYGLICIHYWVPSAAAVFIVVILVFGTNEQEKVVLFEESEEEKALKKADESIIEVCSTTDLLGADTRWPIVRLLSNGDYVFLLFGVFLTGCARSVMSTFLTMYLQEEMLLDEQQAATAAICGIILEVVAFFGSAFYLRSIGIYWMLVVAQLAMTVRAWAYFAIPPKPTNWWLVYLVELLKGVAFAFTQTSGVRLANQLVPPGLEATAQSLMTGMYSMLPAVLVACVGGKVIEEVGSHRLFLATAILTSVSLVLFVCKYAWDGHILRSRR